MRAAYGAIGLVLSLVLAGCSGGEVAVSGEVKQWSFTDIDGATHSTNSSKGKPTLLFFMATWCSSCQATAPRLATVHHEFHARGVNFYTLSFDPKESVADIRGWQDRYDHHWPHAVDEGLRTAGTFSITRQSSIVILDEDGAERRKWIYAVPSVQALREALEAAYGG